jgi:hypothetical protein
MKQFSIFVPRQLNSQFLQTVKMLAECGSVSIANPDEHATARELQSAVVAREKREGQERRETERRLLGL